MCEVYMYDHAYGKTVDLGTRALLSNGIGEVGVFVESELCGV
jgi:hypothetical protein